MSDLGLNANVPIQGLPVSVSTNIPNEVAIELIRDNQKVSFFVFGIMAIVVIIIVILIYNSIEERINKFEKILNKIIDIPYETSEKTENIFKKMFGW